MPLYSTQTWHGMWSDRSVSLHVDQDLKPVENSSWKQIILIENLSFFVWHWYPVRRAAARWQCLRQPDLITPGDCFSSFYHLIQCFTGSLRQLHGEGKKVDSYAQKEKMGFSKLTLSPTLFYLSLYRAGCGKRQGCGEVGGGRCFKQVKEPLSQPEDLV